MTHSPPVRRPLPASALYPFAVTISVDATTRCRQGVRHVLREIPSGEHHATLPANRGVHMWGEVCVSKLDVPGISNL